MRIHSILWLAALAYGQETGSRACAGCHAGIYAKYQATGMARSAGAVGSGAFRESFAQAAFTDAASGANYQISTNYELTFSRLEAGGRRVLGWFVGSGKVGRSYLFSGGDGWLFQAPVSYYSEAQKWDVSPGYQRKRTVELTRTVETACLQCHTSRMQSLATNRFAATPFLEGGVSCERCHGPGQAHIAAKGTKTAIVNPAKLDAERRDSVCAQCHLTGAARVARANAKRYQPGDLLSDSLAITVWSGASNGEANATSHYEKLAQSKCKQVSGAKLWCATCHNPHETVSAAQQAGQLADHYRQACLSCHATKPCTGDAGPDCAGCHMPNRQTRTVDHLAYTDHSIARRPGASNSPVSSTRVLESFWKSPLSSRDLALSYATVAPNEPSVRPRALDLLEQAAAVAPHDVPILVQLAQFYDRLGREEQALALCERIVKLDPSQTGTAVNLGIYRMKRGQAAEAIALWEAALRRNPALTGARMNLAVAHYLAGNKQAAEANLVKALEYEPDLDAARRMLAELRPQ